MQQNHPPATTFGTIGGLTMIGAPDLAMAPADGVCLLMAQSAALLDAQVQALEELAERYAAQRDEIEKYLTRVNDAGGWNYELWLEEQTPEPAQVYVSVVVEEQVAEVTVQL